MVSAGSTVLVAPGGHTGYLHLHNQNSHSHTQTLGPCSFSKPLLHQYWGWFHCWTGFTVVRAGGDDTGDHLDVTDKSLNGRKHRRLGVSGVRGREGQLRVEHGGVMGACPVR